MASTYTTNKVLELPANGDYVDTWNVPANGDFTIIDQAFGGTTSLNATSGSATLTATQYRSLFINISGAISAGVTYTIPSGVGGQWIVYNSTTDASGGPWTITIVSGGGGTSVVIPRSTRIMVVCDGTNVRFLSYIYDNNTVTGNLTVTGSISAGTSIAATTNITAGGNVAATGNVTAGGSITATGNVTAYSDASLKTDVETLTNALETVMKLRGVSYTMINSGEAGIGVIAQETREVLPQVVKDNNGILSVAYANMVGVLIEAVKELSAKVDHLSEKAR
jgi:hypothetical protein